MENDSRYPDWMYDAVYDDSVFGTAYEAVSAPLRGLLKTCIARLYEFCGQSRSSETTTRTSWRQGFSSVVTTMSRSRCCILVDGGVGPAALLAALMPARVAGVPHVAVVHVGEGMPSAGVLVALELAGQELVLGADAAQLAEILTLTAGPSGCVLALGATSALCAGHGGPLWSGPVLRKIGVWTDGDEDIDLDALAFAHPEAEVVHVQGADDIAAAGVKGVFVSASLTEQALKQACVVFGPGHEGCWLYPGLPQTFFTTSRIAWI